MLPEDWKSLFLVGMVYIMVNYAQTKITHKEIYPILNWDDPWETFVAMIFLWSAVTFFYNVLGHWTCQIREVKAERSYKIKLANMFLCVTSWISVVFGYLHDKRLFVLWAMLYSIHLYESLSCETYKLICNKLPLRDAENYLKNIIPMIRLRNLEDKKITVEPQEWKDDTTIPKLKENTILQFRIKTIVK